MALLLAGAPARADDLADFNAAVEATMVHRRALDRHLRNGDRDDAMLELDGMRAAWSKVATLPRPTAFKSTERYTETMLDISARMVGMVLVLNLGRPDVARETLDAIRDALSRLRRENGVRVLADCIADAGIDMAALAELGEKPNFENGAIAAIAQSYGASLRRCDTMADAATRASAEFRRPVDGALASLARLPETIKARDPDALRRLLIELRAFGEALAARYG